MRAGVTEHSILRLGNTNKMSDAVRQSSVSTQDSKFVDFEHQRHTQLRDVKDYLNEEMMGRYQIASSANYSWRVMKRYLMENDFEDIARQLEVPKDEAPGFSRVGKKGDAMREDYLWKLWRNGDSRPALSTFASQPGGIWDLDKEERAEMIDFWISDRTDIDTIISNARRYEDLNLEHYELRNQPKLRDMMCKKIVACTTSFAAKNHALIEGYGATTVLVEEAAEILESHVLVNLSHHVERLIMIGDHKQLRPKLESYSLRSESGHGINFDKSLFERLIDSGYPYSSLNVQHRMRPEISQMIRYTYPDLQDHPSVSGRDNIRGVSRNIAFIDHRNSEKSGREIVDVNSKTNAFESAMVMKMVIYLLQQGYEPDDIVILTPYLGQLRLLRSELRSNAFATQMSDLDHADFKKSGLDDSSDDETIAKSKPTIRIATIDNYQGEESKIIIASLVRSNAEGDIGFMAGPERVNVLFSRARDGFYLIGDSNTFKNAKTLRGRELWDQVMTTFEDNNLVSDGFPAVCTRHGHQTTLKRPEDFDSMAPDGGCCLPCDVVLPSCPYQHTCPKKCHAGDNHVDVKCRFEVEYMCAYNHRGVRACFASQPPCTKSRMYACPRNHQVSIKCHENEPRQGCKQCKDLDRAKEQELAKLSADQEDANVILHQLELSSVQAQASLESAVTKKRNLLAKQSIEREILATQAKAVSIECQVGQLEQNKPFLSGPLGANATGLPVSTDPSASDTALSKSTESGLPATGDSLVERAHLTEAVIDDDLAIGGPAQAHIGKRSLSFSTLLALLKEEEWLKVLNHIKISSDITFDALHRDGCTDLAASLLLLVAHMKLGEDPKAVKLCLQHIQLVYNSRLNERGQLILEHDVSSEAIAGIYYYTAATVSYDEANLTNLSQHYASLYLSISESTDLPASWTKAMVAMQRIEKASQLTLKDDSVAASWVKEVLKLGKSPSSAMDALLEMTGLERVKSSFLQLYHRVLLSKEQRKSLSDLNFNTRFDGNPGKLYYTVCLIASIGLLCAFAVCLGTGKTTVAELYCSFCVDIGLLPTDAKIIKRTGSELANMGVSALQTELESLIDVGGGVVFVDEAYQLDSTQGRPILDFILGHSEKMSGKYGSLVWLFAGYKKKLDDLFTLNIGLPSRFPHTFTFDDYSDEEMCCIFKGLMSRGGNGIINPALKPSPTKPASLQMPGRGASRADEQDEWGNTWRWDSTSSTYVDEYNNITGLGARDLGSRSNPLISRATKTMWIYDRSKQHWYNLNCPSEVSTSYPGNTKSAHIDSSTAFVVSDDKWLRIAIARLGRLRNTVGFGNARAVKNLFDLSHSRQVERITKLRGQGFRPDIKVFERNDFLGPKATKKALEQCPAWKEMNQLEGLDEVKKSIELLLDLLVRNADREEQEKPVLDVALNRIFLGNPGMSFSLYPSRISHLFMHLLCRHWQDNRSQAVRSDFDQSRHALQRRCRVENRLGLHR